MNKKGRFRIPTPIKEKTGIQVPGLSLNIWT